MKDKQQLIADLTDIYARWEALLASVSEAQIMAHPSPSELSIKDELAHLRAWQQRSIARVEAALRDTEPDMPRWPTGDDPEARAVIDQTNAWIQASYRDQSWPTVYHLWRDGFHRFLALASQLPESDLQAVDKYPWLEGYALAGVLEGSCEHHAEHLDELLKRLSPGHKMDQP